MSATAATARSPTAPGLLTGAVTVTTAVPLFPSLVAVMVAAPAVSAVTNPLDTVATADAFVAHATARPPRTFPAASLRVTTSRTLSPAAMVTVDGATVTVATGAGGTETKPIADVSASPVRDSVTITWKLPAFWPAV